MFRGEYRIAKPTKCVKHSDISTINCSADVFYPKGDYIKIPLVTCEMYETVSETKHYFFSAKVHEETTRPFATPSIATCAKLG